MGEHTTTHDRQNPEGTLIDNLPYHEQMERRFGMDDAANLLVGALRSYQWPAAILSVLEQAGQLDRREAVESLRRVTDDMLERLERWSREMRGCLDRQQMDDTGDAPPAMRKVVQILVNALNHEPVPDGELLRDAIDAVEDLAGWFSIEGTRFVDTNPGDEGTHHTRYAVERATITESLLGDLVDKDMLRGLLTRLRGDDKGGA